MENIFEGIKMLMLVIEMIVLTILLDALLPRKTYSQRVRNLVYFLSCTGIFIIATIMPISPLKLVFTTAFNLLIPICLYEGKIIKKVFITIGYIGIMFICDTLTIVSFSDIMQLQVEDVTKKNTISVLMVIVSHCLQFILVNIVNRVKNKKDIAFNKVELLAYIAPLSTIGIIKIILNYETNNYIPIAQLGSVLIVSMGLLLSNIFIWKTFEYMIEQDRQKRKYQQVQEIIKKQYLYYRNIEVKQEESKKMWHDINNHLNCIRSLIDSKHPTEAEQYLNKINLTIHRLKGTIQTGNLISDAIFNEKYEFATMHNINMKIDVNLQGIDWIEQIDLCTLYSNLLDNAIEASLKLEQNKREILVETKVIKGFLIVKILNNTFESVQIKTNRIKTTKSDKNNHGIGLRNVCETIDKYNGTVDMKCENNQFSTDILIPLPM